MSIAANCTCGKEIYYCNGRHPVCPKVHTNTYIGALAKEFYEYGNICLKIKQFEDAGYTEVDEYFKAIDRAEELEKELLSKITYL